MEESAIENSQLTLSAGNVQVQAPVITNEGEVFLKNENFKQKIRRLKEEIVNYEAIISVSSEKQERESFEKIIKFHRKFINKYSAYGSQDW